MAAVSKACASSVTYPFSVAKARAQISSKRMNQDESSASSSDETSTSSIDKSTSKSSSSDPSSARSKLPKPSRHATIFSTVAHIIRTEGLSTLYEGIPLELLKGFLSHGTTMIVKQYIHRLIVHTFYLLSLLVRRLQSKGVRNPAKLLQRADEQRVEYYDLARTRAIERVRDTKQQMEKAGQVLQEGLEVVFDRANETAELVADYVEEEAEEWRSLYGTTGLAKWFDTRND